MTDQLHLGFTGRPRTVLMRRLGAMVAPIATDAGSVVDDESVIDIARAVCAAFSHEDAAGGLTKAEIAARVGGACSEADLESRLGVFIRMELLRPMFDKKHQQRYVLASSGLVGMLVVDRFAERGGVEELLGLLDRTKRALRRHDASEAEVADALETCRATFAVFANELQRLAADAPLSEVLAERGLTDEENYRQHVEELQALVTEQFPSLDQAAYKLLLEALRYVSAATDVLMRVLDHGGETRNFRLLAPEEYLQAARTASVEELARVSAHVTFDDAHPWVDAAAIVDAVEHYRPKRAGRNRPPEPPAGTEGDPVDDLTRREQQTTQRRVLQAEARLGGTDAVDLTDTLRASGWPGAATLLADLLMLDAVTEQPYRVALGDALLVDREGPLTYVTPVHLSASR